MLNTIYIPWRARARARRARARRARACASYLDIAQGQPLRKFHFFAKNLENRQYFTFLAIFDPFLMYLGPETYITFESRTGAKF